MSLILEALRKSEAERRRGQLPDLHAELPPATWPAQSRRPAWAWLLALALTIIALVAVAWLLGGTPSMVERSDSPVPIAVAVPSIQPPAPMTPMPVEANEPGSLRRPAPQAATPAVRNADVDQRSAPLAADPAPVATPRPVVKAPPPARAPAAAPTPALAPARARAPTPTPTPTPTIVPASAPVAPTTVRAPPAIGKSTPVHLADLSAEERRALPPLKISMHMWAPTSAGRFAIIDGARVNEGDRLGDAVIDQITRDGVVLAWHGRRVQLPIQ